MATLYLTYSEQKSGGEVCQGQESDNYPMYEDTCVDWSLLKCYKTKDPKDFSRWQSEQVEVGFDPAVGSDVYVVYVRYQTGGSFSTTHGAWAIVGVYQTGEEAKQIRQSITDKTFEGYTPWEGYFQHLQGTGIEYMQVEP